MKTMPSCGFRPCQVGHYPFRRRFQLVKGLDHHAFLGKTERLRDPVRNSKPMENIPENPNVVAEFVIRPCKWHNVVSNHFSNGTRLEPSSGEHTRDVGLDRLTLPVSTGRNLRRNQQKSRQAVSLLTPSKDVHLIVLRVSRCRRISLDTPVFQYGPKFQRVLS